MFSPCHEAIFQGIKDTYDLAVGHHTPCIRVLRPTCGQCALMHLQVLYSTLGDEAVDVDTDTESKARINGVTA